MKEYLAMLERLLDECETIVRVFFRNDDAGWCDERLLALGAIFERYGMPFDIAVIPQAIGRPIIRRLLDLRERREAIVGFHQHGLAHTNHEPDGRSCEFGPARSADAQLADLAAGREMLQALLGDAVAPFFTPPWNRCSPVTGQCLVRLGFRLLSRDLSAGRLTIPGLIELPVTFAWPCAGRSTLTSFEAGVRAALRHEMAIGVMLHHAVMDDADRRWVELLLETMSRHPRVRCVSMAEASGATE